MFIIGNLSYYLDKIDLNLKSNITIMKRPSYLILFAVIFFFSQCSREQINWKIGENPIITDWASKVDPLKPWPEYPRPDMVRKDWINLNGLWDYSVKPIGSNPDTWEGKILVPYPVESALSGVKRRVSENENLWYRTEFKVPGKWGKGKILLNFEACDWETKVWIDGNEAGSHKGGYDPFSFEISGLLNNERSHELLVCVWDPTSTGTQPRGKQINNPGGIWYTPTTGIWQTVWMEPVEEAYITSFRMVPDIDTNKMLFIVNSSVTGTAEIRISDKGTVVASGNGTTGNRIDLSIDNPVLWSPENPFLYDVAIDLKVDNAVTDKVTSVAGMRKISLGKTEDGFTRMLLNNKFVFQNGPLDQGFWPDGLYTPPTEEAMVYDLIMTKKMGFNMLRKHVKVENRIFYNWCDRMGILVWQDMPSGDSYISGQMPDITKSGEAGKQFEYELKRMIETRYNNPSIIMWVPFNEGWGQWDTERITDLVKEYDPSRLCNSASGWTDRGTGDLKDIHTYPNPRCPEPEEKRATVIGEYGGLGFPVKDHTWETTNWGYRTLGDTQQLLATFESYLDEIYRFVNEKGLSAVIYTQTTDVETETNGLMTYDRKVDKMGFENVTRANTGITPPVLDRTILVFSDEFPVKLNSHDRNAKIFYTLDGSEPDNNSKLFTEPFTVNQPGVIKAFALYGDKKSRTASYEIIKKDIVASKYTGKFKAGLKVNIYDGEFTNLPDFKSLTSAKEMTSKSVNARIAEKETNFAMTFDGYINIPENGIYGIFINSDDGSKVIIDDEIVLLNDGLHPRAVEKFDYYGLGKGYHKIRIEYFFTSGRRPMLRLSYETPGQVRSELPENWLFQ